MPKLPALKSSEVVRALERAGFVRVRQRGSHLRLKRGNLAVTVPIHPGDLPANVLRSILRQAQLTEKEFLALL
ncbi:MAG: addiction module toxin, HicA family [Lysobacteraceae bacterium]|nr:MAG: addiction module toxin, HicA family [Xanthomonadaceae bacterium]